MCVFVTDGPLLTTALFGIVPLCYRFWERYKTKLKKRKVCAVVRNVVARAVDSFSCCVHGFAQTYRMLRRHCILMR